MKHCGSVPLKVYNFFHRELNRTVEKKMMKQGERLLREEITM